ncbi:hypothetical protein BCEN4_350111 [Burkholderia cenocepacia]|nr:hypothetical protein BCEN4_350111 [Burkholderia cenocepacia]
MHTERQRGHVAPAPRSISVSAGIFPREERRLAGQQAASAEGAHGLGTGANAHVLRDGSRQDDARNRRAIPAVRRRNPCLHMAYRRGTWRIHGGVWPYRVSRRASGISCLVRSRPECRVAPVFGQDDRRPVALHWRQARLGHLFGAGRARSDENEGDDEHARHRADRRRRPLDPAGATGQTRRVAARLREGVKQLGFMGWGLTRAQGGVLLSTPAVRKATYRVVPHSKRLLR